MNPSWCRRVSCLPLLGCRCRLKARRLRLRRATSQPLLPPPLQVAFSEFVRQVQKNEVRAARAAHAAHAVLRWALAFSGPEPSLSSRWPRPRHSAPARLASCSSSTQVRRVVIDSATNAFTFTLRDTSPLYKMLPGGCEGGGAGRGSRFPMAPRDHSSPTSGRPYAACLTPPPPPALRCPSPPPRPAESLDRQHLTFTTTRPADYPTPYELMMKHNIQFSAVDKKAGRLATLLVRGVRLLHVPPSHACWAWAARAAPAAVLSMARCGASWADRRRLLSCCRRRTPRPRWWWSPCSTACPSSCFPGSAARGGATRRRRCRCARASAGWRLGHGGVLRGQLPCLGSAGGVRCGPNELLTYPLLSAPF